MHKFLAAVLSGMVLFSVTGDAEKIVIAHRGASGYLPEHTLEAYAMAYGLGADYIEPDLVRTKDGAFVALHDIHLEGTTNVEEVYPDRHREDGKWYAIDFTLSEIKQLQAHERLPKRFPNMKSSFRVPTFEEVIELVQGLNESTGKDVGLYPELKSPAFHAKEGQPMEADFLRIVTGYGYKDADAKIFVQSFEPEPLKTLRNVLGCDLPMIMLFGGGDLSEDMLDKVAEFANGIGPDKGVIERNPEIVKWAHARNLQVHPYTIRRDMKPGNFESTEAEYEAYYVTYDVDGLFTDFTDDAANFLRSRGLK